MVVKLGFALDEWVGTSLRRKNQRLNRQIMKTQFLKIEEIKEQGLIPAMWTIYKGSFDIPMETFLESMKNFDSYALFFTKSGNMVGFSGIRDGKTTLDGKLYRTVYMGHFSVAKRFRGKSLIPFALIRIFADHYLNFRKGRLVVWGDAGTYRSYLVMAKGTKHFYPNPNPPAGHWHDTLAQISREVGKECVSGTFDPDRGVVHSRTQIAMVPEYVITNEDMQDPHINFYVKRNPGYRKGDGMVFLCPANFANLWYFMVTKGTLKKMVRKTVAKMLPMRRKVGAVKREAEAAS